MIEEGLRTLVKDDSAINAIVSDRVYGMKLPQKPTLPAIVFFRVSGPRGYDTNGQISLTPGRFQFDCWDNNLKGARDLATALRKLLSGYSGTAGAETIQGAFLGNDRDLFDSVLNAHRVQMDFEVWYDEATS